MGEQQRLRNLGTTTVVLCVLLFLATGCSDDTGATDGGSTDAAVSDLLTTDAALWPCTQPGRTCNPHDPCAIDPVCGQDLLCRPANYMDCDDGLDCTQDICKGPGLCGHIPDEGLCALPVKGEGGTEIKCFSSGETKPGEPCLECAPEKETSKWSGKNGGGCDDDNSCTKDDYCQNGICKGVYYGTQCADQFGCTDDFCDGQGGCLGSQLKPDWCLINGVCHKEGGMNPDGSCQVCDVKQSQSTWSPVLDTCLIGGTCYKPGDKHPGGCAECDTNSSTSSWTVKVTTHCLINNVCIKSGVTDSSGCGVCEPTKNKYGFTQLSALCKIGAKCYKPGEMDITGCGQCDPAKNPTGWTPVANKCLILGQCLDPNDPDPTGCMKCDPQQSSTSYTPVPGKCLIRGACYNDGVNSPSGCGVCTSATSTSWWTPSSGASQAVTTFEGGLSGYTVTPLVNKVGWQVSTKRAHNGTSSLYYGNPAAGNYETGGPNKGSATSAAIALPAGQKAALHFWLFMDAEPKANFDVLRVLVSSTVAWIKEPFTTMPLDSFKTWTPVEVDLSPFAGSNVSITFEFDTKDGWENTYEGVYLDDVTILTQCGSL